MRFRIDARAAAAIGLALALPVFAQAPADSCETCGVVASIVRTTERQQWTPLGTTGTNAVTATGRVTDPTTQFSIGPQLKNQGLVVIGAAGGATSGKRPNAYEKPRWDVTVKMDRGGTRVVSQSYEPMLREGDRVRVLGSQLDLLNP
jgi:outer membrane lipoprotein SlyB